MARKAGKVYNPQLHVRLSSRKNWYTIPSDKLIGPIQLVFVPDGPIHIGGRTHSTNHLIIQH